MCNKIACQFEKKRLSILGGGFPKGTRIIHVEVRMLLLSAGISYGTHLVADAMTPASIRLSLKRPV